MAVTVKARAAWCAHIKKKEDGQCAIKKLKICSSARSEASVRRCSEKRRSCSSTASNALHYACCAVHAVLCINGYPRRARPARTPDPVPIFASNAISIACSAAKWRRSSGLSTLGEGRTCGVGR